MFAGKVLRPIGAKLPGFLEPKLLSAFLLRDDVGEEFFGS